MYGTKKLLENRNKPLPFKIFQEKLSWREAKWKAMVLLPRSVKYQRRILSKAAAKVWKVEIAHMA